MSSSEASVTEWLFKHFERILRQQDPTIQEEGRRIYSATFTDWKIDIELADENLLITASMINRMAAVTWRLEDGAWSFEPVASENSNQVNLGLLSGACQHIHSQGARAVTAYISGFMAREVSLPLTKYFGPRD